MGPNLLWFINSDSTGAEHQEWNYSGPLFDILQWPSGQLFTTLSWQSFLLKSVTKTRCKLWPSAPLQEYLSQKNNTYAFIIFKTVYYFTCIQSIWSATIYSKIIKVMGNRFPPSPHPQTSSVASRSIAPNGQRTFAKSWPEKHVTYKSAWTSFT